MMTIDSAELLGQYDETGSLIVGKYADFVVLDQDIFEIQTRHIDQTEILATIMNGKVMQ